MQFCRETVIVQTGGKDYRVTMEYAAITIDRPWFYISLFPYRLGTPNLTEGKYPMGQETDFSRLSIRESLWQGK